MRALLGIAGGIGSGKSSVAAALSDQLDGQRRSFGDAVRAEAARRGLGEDRTALQDLGNVLIDEGWVRFVELVMDTVEATEDLVVIDGIRHHEAIDAFRPLSNGRAVGMIFVRTSREIRIERLMARDQMTRADAEAAMAHPNEQEVESLIEVADLVVDNDEPLDEGTLANEVRERFS